jgi:multidrug efflux pump subunit AcrB
MKDLNFAGKIAHFFGENQPLSILVIVATAAMGIFGYFAMPKQYNPEIILPVFQVEVPYPGARADEVESFITRKLEEKIAEIPGVDKISSQSIDGGISIVTVEFLVGEDLELSKIKLFTKIQENLDLRFGNIGTPMIKNINPDDVPIITFALFSETLSQNEIREKAVRIIDQLRDIPGISNLQIHGGETRALNIFLDPEILRLRKFAFSDVINALQKQNVRMIAGTVKDEKQRHEIEIDGTLLNAKDVGEIVIAPNIQLKDIATIEDGISEKTSFVSFREKNTLPKDAVYLSIAKRKGENASTVADAIIKKMNILLQRPDFQSIDQKVVQNEGESASKEITKLGGNLLQSIAIVAIVLLFFLGFRAALVVAIAIPFTLLLVFFVGYIAGETINRITLFALILSLGLLVDSATVVVENIYRHIGLNKNRKVAIPHAVGEIGGGLFFSTLTSIIVFLPLTKVTGMMGPYMGPIAFFVPLALIMSLFVAYVITPFLSKLLLPIPKEKKSPNLFDRISEQYAKLLDKILSRKKVAKRILWGVFLLLFLVMTFPVLEIIHFRMLPKADKEQFYIYIDAPEGTDTPETSSIADRISTEVLKYSEVISVQSFVGESPVLDFNGLYRGSAFREAPHIATLRISLLPPEQRGVSSENIVLDIREKIEAIFPKESKIHFRLVEDPPGPPVQATLVAKIKGPNPKIREEITKDVEAFFQNTQGVVDIDTSLEEPFPRTIFSIDQNKAKQLGITSIEIMDALETALTPQKISQFHIKGQEEMAFLEVQIEKTKRDNVGDLSKISIKSVMGQMIPLSSVIKKTPSAHPATLYLDEQVRTDYVTAEMGERSVVYAAIDLIGVLLSYKFSDDGKKTNWNLFGISYTTEKGEEYQIEWGGEWKMTLENFRDLGLAMMVAFFFIYAILVAQFRSFSIPLLIMATIPLGLVGILTGFAFLDLTNGIFFTATGMIGFIALMGIVVNNAILYLEYFNILQSQGIGIKESLIEAGRIRLRPIMLTSITTVLGSLTIASDPVWSGLAWAIVFGLSLSTVLTLGIFPILYFLVYAKKT